MVSKNTLKRKRNNKKKGTKKKDGGGYTTLKTTDAKWIELEIKKSMTSIFKNSEEYKGNTSGLMNDKSFEIIQKSIDKLKDFSNFINNKYLVEISKFIVNLNNKTLRSSSSFDFEKSILLTDETRKKLISNDPLRNRGFYGGEFRKFLSWFTGQKSLIYSYFRSDEFQDFDNYNGKQLAQELKKLSIDLQEKVEEKEPKPVSSESSAEEGSSAEAEGRSSAEAEERSSAEAGSSAEAVAAVEAVEAVAAVEAAKKDALNQIDIAKKSVVQDISNLKDQAIYLIKNAYQDYSYRGHY